MSKFSVWTFGCRCNQADSAAIREGLCRRAMGEAGRARASAMFRASTMVEAVEGVYRAVLDERPAGS